MGFSDEIMAKWQAETLATPGTDLFRGPASDIPAGPGPYIQINETGGSGPQFIQNSDAPNLVNPSMQVVVIAKGRATAMTKALSLYNSVSGLWNMVIGGTFYQRVVPDQEPFDLPVDPSNRSRVAFNISAKKRLS